jgi:PA14 domain
MRSLLRTLFLGLICLLFIASSDAVNRYGHRSWRSLAAVQSSSVVTVNPGANQTPDPGQGGEAVSSQTNTGHGSTQSAMGRDGIRGGASQTKTCLWHSFSNVSGIKTRVTLKFDWTLNAGLDVWVDDSSTGATAEYNFRIEYSLDNGSTWTVRGGANDSIHIGGGPGMDGRRIDTSGSESVDLPNPGAIDITQIRVRDRIFASVDLSGAANASASSDATASVSNIRLEVEAWNCIASVPTDRWKGEYFNNQTLEGSPTMVRDDTDGAGFFSLNFGSGSPHSVCAPAADNFSARWTRTVNLAQGIYRFTASVDNGMRLYVDGYRRIDKWGNLPPNTYTADVFLSAGNHEIKLEFIEYTGDASVSLSWAAVSGANCIASVSADRWKGEYYSNTNLSGSPAMVRDDGGSFLNFDFGGGGPGSGCGLGEDYFSARWTRTVNLASGNYRFSVTGDDGVRLYVDGQLVIDKWFIQGATTYTANVTLRTTGPHQVKLEYFEDVGSAVALLSWTQLTSLSCLPDVPIIGSAPRTGGGESIATTPVSEAPKRCGQKSSE